MTTLRRYVPSTAGQLLGYILDRRELVAAVRELPGTILSRLMDRVGLEDCSELIALASSEQLEVMFDADLWRTDVSGFDESACQPRLDRQVDALARKCARKCGRPRIRAVCGRRARSAPAPSYALRRRRRSLNSARSGAPWR